MIISISDWEIRSKECLRMIHTIRKNNIWDKFFLFLNGNKIEALNNKLKELYNVDVININIDRKLWQNSDKRWKFGLLLPFFNNNYIDHNERICYIDDNYYVNKFIEIPEELKIGEGYLSGITEEFVKFCKYIGDPKNNNSFKNLIKEYKNIKEENNINIINDNKIPIENSIFLEQRMFYSTSIKDMMKPTLTVYIPTRGRNDLTLPMAIRSVLSSSYIPDQLVIIDDNDEDIEHSWIYSSLTDEAKLKKIMFYFIKGKKKGQIISHEFARVNIKTDLIFRMDDDNILGYDTLEKLVEVMVRCDDVGCCSCTIIDPKYPFPPHELIRTDIESVKWGSNIQWHIGLKDKMYEVQHLYSCMMYKREAGLASPYPVKGKFKDRNGKYIRISRVGHREETIFSHGIYHAGWRLVVRTDTVMLHYASNSRYNPRNKKYFDNDNYVFDEISYMRGVKFKEIVPIPAMNGIGDQYELLRILPEILDKYKDKLVIIGTSFKDIFNDYIDKNLIIVSPNAFISQFGERTVNLLNVYNIMTRLDWKGHISDAYRILYGLKPLPVNDKDIFTIDYIAQDKNIEKQS